LEPIDINVTGWAAWPQPLADQARVRYDWHQIRVAREQTENDERLENKALMKLADLPAHTKGAEDNEEVLRKRRIIEAALAKAQQRRQAREN
jgi:electron transport complex protein RnfB